MKLLNSQKNTIFQIIENNEFFTPYQFELTETEVMGDTTTSIIFKDSPYYFKFFESTEYVNSLVVNYSPGGKQIMDASAQIDWNSSLHYFQIWLSNLHREINSPNLWERLKAQVLNVPGQTDSENTKFTYEEYKDVTGKLNLLIDNLSTLNLEANQQREIKQNLERLIELAETSPKVDWKNLFLGTIISIIIQLNVSTENANALWELIKKVFNNYFLS